MTDKKALEVLKSWLRLAYQNADGTDDDSAELYEALQTVFALINRQKAENERLQSMNQAKLDTIHDIRTENERLKDENKILSINADNAFQDGLNEAQDLYAEQIKNEVKAEAVKEFAGEFERSLINMPQKDINYSNLVEHIENLLKEKVGGADDFSNRAL